MANPSIADMLEEFVDVKRKTGVSHDEFVDKETGLITTVQSERMELTTLDKGKFFKFFHKSEEAYMNLTLPGYKLLGYISYRLKETQHEVYLDPEEVMKACKWGSRTMFYRALEDLYANKFLFKHEKKLWHHINVQFFFNGVRTKLVKYRFEKPVQMGDSKVTRLLYVESVEEDNDNSK